MTPPTVSMSVTMRPRAAFAAGFWLIVTAVTASIRRTTVTFERTVDAPR